MTILSIPPLVMSVVAFYVCAYHLLIFLRRPKHPLDLTFALTCLFVGFYDVCCVGNYNSSTPEVGVQWQRMQVITLSLVTTAFLWFVVRYTSMKPGRRRIPVYLMSIVALSGAVIQAVCRPGSGFTWTDQEAVKSFVIPFFDWPVTYNEMAQGPFTDVQAFGFLFAYLYMFWEALHFYWKGNPRKAAPLLLAILIFFAGVIEDVMVSSGFYHFVYTIEYSFVGMLLVMACALSSEFIDAALTRRALQESEDKFRSLVEVSSDWIWEVDSNARYTYASPNVRDILGCDPQEIIGKTPYDLMPPEESQRIREFFEEKARTQQPLIALENVNLHADGRRIVLETSGVPIVDDNGALLGYRGVDRDITERKRAEEALRSEKDFSTTLIQASPAFIVAIAPDGKTMLMNESMRRELGYSASEIAGTDYITTFVPEEDREQLAEVFSRLTDTKEPATNENRVLTRDGRELLVEWQGQQIFGPDGRMEYFIGVGINITERRQAEEEREQLEAQLLQAQKMEAVGQLAGGIAHDFNNILTAILGNAELLKMGLSEPRDQAEFADEIINGANRAADLTGQLLAFARKGKWRVEAVDIHDIVAQTVHMLTHAIDRRIEIRLELNASASTVMGDPTQLHGALLNLGLNARDAMTDGGALTYKTRNTTLSQTDCDEHHHEMKPGGFLEISVSDTGIGMDPQTQKRVFEPFFTTKEVGRGTGLGLAGVYGCVRSHQGSVNVSSAPGRGATFTILLPLADPDAAVWDWTATGGKLVKGSGHILVVDDEESIRNFVRTSLKTLGYTVSLCNDGASCVDYYRQHHRDIDLVILDLVMPNMSGRDAFREMKKINPDVKVLVSSGFSRSQATRQVLDEGALDLLNKPFQITDLSQAVARHIQQDPGS